MKIPTFEEWYADLNDGISFDERNVFPGLRHDEYIQRLSLETQRYLSHVAQLLAESLVVGR